MDIYDIILYLVKGILIILVLILVYTLITRPKEILFGLLRYMKDGRIAATIIFAPIWFPALLLDKHFKLGIFEENSKETNINLDNPDKKQNENKHYR